MRTHEVCQTVSSGNNGSSGIKVEDFVASEAFRSKQPMGGGFGEAGPKTFQGRFGVGGVVAVTGLEGRANGMLRRSEMFWEKLLKA